MTVRWHVPNRVFSLCSRCATSPRGRLRHAPRSVAQCHRDRCAGPAGGLRSLEPMRGRWPLDTGSADLGILGRGAGAGRCCHVRPGAPRHTLALRPSLPPLHNAHRYIPAAARHAPISRAVGDGSWAEAGGAIVAALVHGRIEYSSTLLSGQADGRARLSEFRGAVFVGGFSYADTLDSAKVRRPLNYSTIPCDRREYARARCMLGLAGPGRSCSH